jgi:alkylation response protein AidB-like acyl-CoA dehydrogenase
MYAIGNPARDVFYLAGADIGIKPVQRPLATKSSVGREKPLHGPFLVTNHRNCMGIVRWARVRGVVGFAARILRDAVDPLMSVGGARGFADSSLLQLMWRDLGIATCHVLGATDPSLEIYGRALLGPRATSRQ